MKRKYNTLNEEVNRMKSLFGESRLYGNLVDNQEDTLITEQFQKLKSLFKLNKLSRLKNVGKVELDSFYKGLEFNGLNSFSKHVGDNLEIWQVLLPDVNWVNVKKVLEYAGQNEESIRALSDADFIRLQKMGLSVLPNEGDMKIIYLRMLDAKRPKSISPGGGNIKPHTSDVNTIITDPEGNIVGTFKNGKWFGLDNKEFTPPKNAKYKNYDDFEVVTDSNGKKGGIIDSNGTVVDLGGKVTKIAPGGTTISKPYKEAIDIVGEKMEEAVNNNQILTTEMTFPSHWTQAEITEYQRMLTDNGFVAKDKEGFIKDTAKTVEDEKKLRKLLKNVVWKTRYVWNPTTAGEEGIAKSLGKTVNWIEDANRFKNTREGKVVFRMLAILPTTLWTLGVTSNLGDRVWDPDHMSNNIIFNAYGNLVLILTRKAKEGYEGGVNMGVAAADDILNDTFGIDTSLMQKKISADILEKLKPENINQDSGISCRDLCGDCNFQDGGDHKKIMGNIVKRIADAESINIGVGSGEGEKTDRQETSNKEVIERLSGIDISNMRKELDLLIAALVEREVINEDNMEALGELQKICKEYAKTKTDMDWELGDENTVEAVMA